MDTETLFRNSLDFDAYMELTRNLVNRKVVTPVYEPEKMLKYTAANLERMEYVLQHLQINKKLYNRLQQPGFSMDWLVITEPWCGDASQIVPVLYLVSQCNADIRFRLVLRDEHPELMKQYTTRNTDSIPILICYDRNSGKPMGHWGPRPKVLQEILENYQLQEGESFGTLVRKLHAWYREDLGTQIQEELLLTTQQWINQYAEQNLRNPI